MLVKYNQDSGMILSNFLERRLPVILRRKSPALVFSSGRYLPQIADLDITTQYLTIEKLTEYGEASIQTGAAQDIPLADVSISEESYPILCVVAGCSYSERELKVVEKAKMNGLYLPGSLSDLRLQRMRDMITEKSNFLGAFGNQLRNFTGVINNPDVPLVDSTFVPGATDNTGQEYIDWISDIITGIRVATNLVEQPNVILCTEKLYRKFTTTFRSEASDVTLYDAILKANPSIRAIEPLNELQSSQLEVYKVHSDNTDKDRMIIANLNIDNFYRRISGVEVMSPQLQGLDWKVFAYQCFSGVIFNYPMSARYVDYAKM